MLHTMNISSSLVHSWFTVERFDFDSRNIGKLSRILAKYPQRTPCHLSVDEVLIKIMISLAGCNPHHFSPTLPLNAPVKQTIVVE